ncbi:MAG: PAS domain S-box protein [Rhodocyclales bacterium]|nr:PAS domain S-box protein [Rhodocyclales bacterium]
MLDLSTLPVIAFSASVRDGTLRVARAEGGLLQRYGAGNASDTWLGEALHPDETSVWMTPPPGDSRQRVRLRDADGAWCWLDLRIGQAAVDGDTLRYTALLTDATEYQALEETAQRYRDYTEIASDWYWEMDEDLRFSYFSREFEQVTGVPIANAIGKTRWGGLGRENLGNVDWEAHKQQLFAHLPFRNFEYPSRRPDGRLVWFRVSGLPRFDENGRFTGYYGIASDISAIRRMEEHLRQSDRLASIGQLAAGVAHEINNPVSFVRSNVETLGNYLRTLRELVERYAALEAEYPNPDLLKTLMALRSSADLEFLDEDAPQLLAECRDGLERVRKIVADLREFCHEGEAEWSMTDIHACLDSAINLFSAGLPDTLEIRREYATLPPLHCCPPQLNQVFLALLCNAGQAIGEQPGRITIRTGQGDDATQWMEVADTGCGIAPEHLPRIFEPFFTTRPPGMGTGMGLATCFGIVAEHGGRIEVHSTPGVGTCFRVVLAAGRS